MLRAIRNNRAQAISSEYVMVFFIVIAVSTAMTIYFKRSIQARMRDARMYMVKEIITRTNGVNFVGNGIWVEYEPYYTHQIAQTDRFASVNTFLLPSLPASSGIFRQNPDIITSTEVFSNVLPPKDFAD